MERRRLVAIGGGGCSTEPDNPLLDQFVLSLARSRRPRVCFLPTASGDSEDYIARFYRGFAALDCRPCDLRLFRRELVDLESFILAQDVLYVGDGNTVNLLAVWRAHGLDHILVRAWSEGIVLAAQRLIAAGELADGWAADDGAALVFGDQELAEVVTSRPGAAAYRVERHGPDIDERRLTARYLGPR